MSDFQTLYLCQTFFFLPPIKVCNVMIHLLAGWLGSRLKMFKAYFEIPKGEINEQNTSGTSSAEKVAGR